MHREVKFFGQDYICFEKDGEVMSEDRQSHTSSYTTPGKTTYTQVPGTAIVTAHHSRGSTVVNTSHSHHFWVKFADNSENKYILDQSPNVRASHKVRIYCLMRKGESEGWAFYMKNQTTGAYTDIRSNDVLNDTFKIYNDNQGLAGFFGILYALFLIFGAPAIGIVKESWLAFIVSEIIGFILFRAGLNSLAKDEDTFKGAIEELKGRLRAEA